MRNPGNGVRWIGHLKNMDTNSSGGGVVGADFFFKMLEITVGG